MVIQTTDFQILDCSRVRITSSTMARGTRFTVQAQPKMEPTDRGSSLIDLYQTFDAGAARKLVSLMVAHENDHIGGIVPLPELIARLSLEAKEEVKNAV